VVQTDLAEKKEKKKNLLLSKTSHIWRRFSSRKINVFTGMGCVNQNHNKDTTKSEKSMSCVVIKSTLEQFQNELLELGRALLSLLDVAYPDTKAVLAAIVKIEFLMQDQPEDISDQWVTARVKTDNGKRFISNLSVRKVRVYYCSFPSTVLHI